MAKALACKARFGRVRFPHPPLIQVDAAWIGRRRGLHDDTVGVLDGYEGAYLEGRCSARAESGVRTSYPPQAIVGGDCATNVKYSGCPGVRGAYFESR